MPIHFPNLKRPKQASKRITRVFPKVRLAQAQQAIAICLGYRDWFDLERGHASSMPSPLDEQLPIDDARQRWTNHVLSLSRNLDVPQGDIQSVMDLLRLTGNHRLTFEDHEVIRTRCWRLGPLPVGRNRDPGMTCVVTHERRKKGRERAYIRKFRKGMGVNVISNTSDMGLRADFEVIAPRVPISDFLPLRLWLPYGRWTLRDHREVFFSRDYCPLWIVSPEGKVDRVHPGKWIEDIEESRYFSKMSGQLWYADATIALAKEALQQHNITALPMLVDVLPILVTHPEQMRAKAAANLLPPTSIAPSD